MTNPAQLKYLDAIGIPVWISRDRVIDESELLVSDADLPHSHIGSVEDILQGLDEKLEKPLGSNVTSDTINKKIVRDPITEPPVSDRERQHEKLANEVGRTSQHLVFASGNLDADWMLIGESPELNEPYASQPFATESGVLIDQMLKSVGMENPRTDAHIVHVTKHAFSSNTDSSSELNELLVGVIQRVSPKIIIVVGQNSAQNLLQTKEPLARLRSKPHQLTDKNIPVVVTYYPTYLLSKPLDKRKAWEDLKLAMSIMKTDSE